MVTVKEREKKEKEIERERKNKTKKGCKTEKRKGGAGHHLNRPKKKERRETRQKVEVIIPSNRVANAVIRNNTTN